MRVSENDNNSTFNSKTASYLCIGVVSAKRSNLNHESKSEKRMEWAENLG